MDALAGTDFSQYQNWEKVVTPSGGTYYVVPGTAYVYDPFLSQSKGKPVLFRNPKQRVADEEQARAAQEQQLRLQKQAASPGGQLLPVAGGLAGTVGAAYLVNSIGRSGVDAAAQTVLNGGSAGAGTGVGGAAPTAQGAFVNAATGAQPIVETTLPVGGGAAPGVATPTGLSAAPIEAAPINGGLGSVLPGGGALGGAVGAAALGSYLSNLYEGGVKDIVRGKGDGADFTNLALDINPVTAPINFGLRLFGQKSIGKMLQSGKSEEQGTRDDYRSAAQKTGLADKDYNVTFGDGSAFNIGVDGKGKLQNVGTNIDGNTERHYYDVDFSNPLAASSVAKVQSTIAPLLGEKPGKQSEQLVGMYVNAVTNGAKDQATVDQRIAELGAKLGGNQAGTPPIPAQGIQKRSSTSSPGIGLNGRPLARSAFIRSATGG